MANWKINGIDISEEFGMFVKRGGYDALINFNNAKPYLTEDFREDNGEVVSFAMPRIEARSVTIPFYFVSDSVEEFWKRLDKFQAFVIGSMLNFELVQHNRTYKLYYQGTAGDPERISLFSKNSDKIVFLVQIVFREPDPSTVLSSGLILTTEDGYPIRNDTTAPSEFFDNPIVFTVDCKTN